MLYATPLILTSAVGKTGVRVSCDSVGSAVGVAVGIGVGRTVAAGTGVVVAGGGFGSTLSPNSDD
jgi:hypothetical protein